MIAVSVVIITKNEAHIISETIKSVKDLTDDIIVVDTGSSDETDQLAASIGARVINTSWQGFGHAKNAGIDAAFHDWILSIDADEQPDEELIASIKNIDLTATDVVYKINFKTYLCNKLIRYGEWGNDAHIRLFNRNKIRWNNAEVHEQLSITDQFKTQPLKGFIHHHTMKDIAEFSTKMNRYALLSAERNCKNGKKATWIKRYLSPMFSFVNNYFFKLGFLDGNEGYIIAKMTSYYTFLKYARLYELQKSKSH